MDCNKDEAIRAKEIAEKRLIEKNFVGAKKIALRAHKLYPKLDSLPQLLTIIDVYIAAERRVNGHLDWYKVLGVDFLDNSDVIRKQYKELVQKICTDENKSVGANGALKLISEAWRVLSDEDDRYDYDQKRNEPRTFWTRCSNCRVQLEYLRTLLNRNLLCFECKQAFLAVEIRPPNFIGPTLHTPQTSNNQQYVVVQEAEAIHEEALRLLTMEGVVPNENSPNGKSSVPTSFNGNNSNSLDQSSATHPQPASSSHHPASTTNVGHAKSSGVEALKTSTYQAGTFSKSCSVANEITTGSSASAGVSQPACEQLKRGHEEAPQAMRDDALRRKTTGAGFANESSNAGSNSIPQGDRPETQEEHIKSTE